MNRPATSKPFRSIPHNTSSFDHPKTRDHNNVVVKHNQRPKGDMLTPHRVVPHIPDDNESSSDDEGETTEDSTDYRLDNRPKPGKLDLRQFDNISTAIGKLNVAPSSSSSPTPIVSMITSTNSTSTHKSSTSKNFTETNVIPITSSRRNNNNLRNNHGRAVPPPKLPSNTPYKATFRSDNEVSASHSRITQYDDDASAIDLSQSPIAQRVLKNSKDHKVSELHSPYASDVEPHSSGVARLNEQFRGPFMEKVPFTRYSSMDSCELNNSRGETIRQLNEILAKKSPGHLGLARPSSCKDPADYQLDGTKYTTNVKKDDKDSKKDRKKMKSDEKLEKRKLKEEERLRRQEEEKQRRQQKKLASKKSKLNSSDPNSIVEDGIPLFIRRCIEFIELEGLDAEGIYRVPGNRAHVDSFVKKFKEDPGMSILESDIPVNAVATALKDFLSKKWGPIIPVNLMNELTELRFIRNREKSLDALKELTRKLPLENYNLLKYVFSHFVRVSHNNMLNNMDSKNLAICWWPTLLPLHFDDMIMFEQMRPHLEETIQTMIDHYSFIFNDGNLT